MHIGWIDTIPQHYILNFRNNKLMQLLLARVFTLGRLPYKNNNNSYITSHTLYYISSGSTQNDPFFVTWLPVNSITGYSTCVYDKGIQAYKNTTCFGLCKAGPVKSSSKYELYIRTDLGVTIPFIHSESNHNWLEDEGYCKTVAMLGVLDHRHSHQV